MKSFPLFLALRYLRPRGSFVSVITLISILGVLLGVAVLVVVMSVMSGFERQIREVTLGFEPHVECLFERGDDDDGNARSGWRDLVEEIRQKPGVTRVAPIIRGHAFMELGGEPVAASLRAVRHEDFGPDSPLAQQVGHGQLELRREAIVLGLGVADQLGANVGDVVTLYSSGNIRAVVAGVRGVSDSDTKDDARAALSELEQVVLPYELEVTGFFQRSWEFDHEVAVPFFLGQELENLDGEMSSLGVWADDSELAGLRAIEFGKTAPEGWTFLPWMEKPSVKKIFETIRTERAMMYLVLFMIVLVAAFSIMNTVITVTVQKRREIGVITALGGRVEQVVKTFLLQGAVVGAFGALLGLGAGLLVVAFRNELLSFLGRFGIQIFPGNGMGGPEIPAELRWGDLCFITIGSFLICTLAALPPAWLAARIDPARALRNE